LMWAPEARLRAMVFWLTGDLGQAASLGWVPTVLGVGTGLAWLLSASLNVLARGELQAKAAGAPVGGLRLAIYLGASLLTSNAVTIAGSVGFVGLLVPHMIRLVIGADHRVVVPGSVLLGGTLLVVADFLAREALWPLELPVGIVTAVIGVPVFLLLLRRT
jgi:iron complex transport system permease protein